MRLVYSSDIHGNESQYRRLVDYAIQNHADALIIGGDIAPKDLPLGKYIGAQRRFLAERLPKLLEP